MSETQQISTAIREKVAEGFKVEAPRLKVLDILNSLYGKHVTISEAFLRKALDSLEKRERIYIKLKVEEPPIQTICGYEWMEKPVRELRAGAVGQREHGGKLIGYRLEEDENVFFQPWELVRIGPPQGFDWPGRSKHEFIMEALERLGVVQLAMWEVDQDEFGSFGIQLPAWVK